MSLHHSPRIVTNGLVLCLDAANSKSYPGTGTTWYDLISPTYNSTIFNGTSYTSNNKGVFVFDGVNDYIRTNVFGKDIVTAQSNFTMSCWVKFTSIPVVESSGTIFGAFNYDGYGIRWDSTLSSMTVGYQMRARLTNTIVGNSVVVPINTWIYLAFVYSATSNLSRFYVDGELMLSAGAISGNFDTTLNTIYLSMGLNTVASGGNPPAYFPGEFSQCQMYNKELTLSEVQQNFNALRGRFGI
jgi:hypothetical protein